MTLAIDYAWQHPTPAAIKADGYSAVLRYLSNDPSKDLTVAEAAALHAAGLSIGLVFETTATRAGSGSGAGYADASAAERAATALGYPITCPIFYAVDYDATPLDVFAYFTGISQVAHHPVGVYGSFRIVEAIMGYPPDGRGKLASYGWQATAWSYDVEQQRVVVSQHAHLFQRLRRTLGPLAGVADTAWDEDVILAPLPLWAPGAVAAPKPAPRPVSRTVVRRPLPARTMLTVDGRLGPKTTEALQSALAIRADGIFGPATAEELQWRLRVTRDGVIGPVTVTALQRHVRAHVDGIWPSVVTPHTVVPNAVSDTTRHLQSALNARAF